MKVGIRKEGGREERGEEWEVWRGMYGRSEGCREGVREGWGEEDGVRQINQHSRLASGFPASGICQKIQSHHDPLNSIPRFQFPTLITREISPFCLLIGRMIKDNPKV